MRLTFLIPCLLFQLLACGQAPEPFLPEVFGQFPNVRDLSISADGKEMYFTVESFKKEHSAILYIRKKGKKWTDPEVASFSGQYRDLEPFLSPDGLKLYFVSTRPASSDPVKKDADIWYVKRTTAGSAWTEPIRLGGPVNSEKDEYYPAITNSGNIYFTRESDDPTRKEDIFISRIKDGNYTAPEPLSDNVNSKTYEFNAYVSPDEQTILFTSYGRPDDQGGSDLYFSQKNSAGEWMAARSLGVTVNSKKIDYCPFWDPKNQVLYFTSERSTITPQLPAPQNRKQLQQTYGQYANGLSRIYRVTFSPDSWFK